MPPQSSRLVSASKKRKSNATESTGDHSSAKRARKCVPVDAGELLDRILADIVDDDERGYKQFLKNTGVDHVKKTLLAAVRGPVRDLLETRSYWDVSKLKSLGGDVKSTKSGIYMDIVTDGEKVDFLRLYTGQAEKFNKRIGEHKRKMHLGQSLHHRVAIEPGRVWKFVLLAEIPELDDMSFWLNIAEMWFPVLFQTLPRPTMAKYLREHELRSTELALNISSPLNQNHGQKSKEEASKMKHSTDPLVQQYWNEVIVPGNQENWARGRGANAKDAYKSIIDAKRAQSKNGHLKRDPETEAEETVVVRCGECRSKASEKVDRAPQYETASDKYIVRGQRCPVCPKRADGKHKQTFFDPVDKSIATIRERQIARKQQ